MPKYLIFASISRKLFIKSLESGVVTIDDLTDDFRRDAVFWDSQINNLPAKIDPSKPTFIHPHPQVNFATISRLDGEQLYAYLDVNPAYISYKVVQFLCNCQLPLTHDIWKDYLLKCLYFHSRELEYEYFLYHLLIRDENVCLLTQTVLTDWMLEGRFSLDIPH